MNPSNICLRRKIRNILLNERLRCFLDFQQVIVILRMRLITIEPNVIETGGNSLSPSRYCDEEPIAGHLQTQG